MNTTPATRSAGRSATSGLSRREPRRALGPVALGGLAVLVVGCGRAIAPSPAGSSAPAAAAAGGETQLIQVRASEFGFSPSTIQVTAGKPVRLVLANTGQIEHDLRVEKIPAAGLKLSEAGHGHGATEVVAHAEQGKEAWVEFTPTKPGRYELNCTISGHKEAGMKGTFIVA